jgi:plastocyanin
MEPNGAFESGIIRVGETFRVTFEKPGVYEYFDSLHPTVSGRITVT